MGAWDTGSFDNDAAMDYIADLMEFKTLPNTLSRIDKCKGIIDSDDASMAIAACDILAIIIGRPPADPPEIPNFCKSKVSDEHLMSAKNIITRIREKSELADLWSEEDDTEWQAALDQLLLRLDRTKPFKAPQKKKQKEIPDDFLGHCYICYEAVTKRDGILFEHTIDFGASCSIHPHRKCIEDAISGPHWKKDGSPTAKTKKKLLKDMGFDI